MTELSAVVRFVQIVAAVVLTGSFAFNLLIARSAVEKAGIGIDGRDILNLRFHRQIVIWSIFVLSVSALLSLCIQVINVSDSTAQTFFDRLDPVSLLTDTQFGKVWLGRMVLLSLLPALLFHAEINRLRYDSFFVLAGGFGLSACLLISISLSGHAAPWRCRFQPTRFICWRAAYGWADSFLSRFYSENVIGTMTGQR